MDLQLRKMREDSKMTQTDLAKAIGTTLRKISAWERGETSIPLEMACIIADYFHVTLDELAGRWEYVGSATTSTREEVEIVEAYRDADARGRENILETARREKRAQGTPQDCLREAK